MGYNKSRLLARKPNKNGRKVNGREPLSSSILKQQDVDTEKDILRLIFWGGGNYPPDNNAFHTGELLVKSEYGANKTIFVTPLASADNLVKSLNNQIEGSIQSLDIFAHGADDEVTMYRYETPDAGWCSPTAFKYNLHANKFIKLKETNPTAAAEAEKAYGMYKLGRTEQSLTFGIWNFFHSSKADIDEIHFSRFKKTAKIEFHGCKTASVEEAEIDGEMITLRKSSENFCGAFSKFLFDATEEEGNKTIVIGHITKASPTKNDDYRHGLRRAYHNGRVLFECRKMGRIEKLDIDYFFNLLRNDDTFGNKFGRINKDKSYSVRSFDEGDK